MKFLLKPGNSLILSHDPHDRNFSFEFQDQIEEIGRYYEWATLSSVVTSLGGRKCLGKACVAFLHPRKSTWLQLVPYLRDRNIPFTVFLRPDCVGTNRLPLEEEVEAFGTAYSSQIFESDWQSVKERAWEAPGIVEEKIQFWRNSVGPLPIDKLDPLRFFASWGKILEIQPKFMEIGWHVPSAADLSPSLAKENLDFLRVQTKQPVQVAYIRNPKVTGNMNWQADLRKLNIIGVVGTSQATIGKNSPPFDLPIWSPEKIEVEEATK